MTRNAAFTLIELLVVITIVAILAAILFPVFASAREAARRIGCISNEKQLGLAIIQYCDDCDEVLPGAAAGGSPGIGATGGWMYYSAYTLDGSGSKFEPDQGSLYVYVKSKAVYICPDDDPGSKTGDSYSYNSCLTSPTKQVASGPGFLWPGKPLALFNQTDDTLLLAEEGHEVFISQYSTNDGLFNMDFQPVGYDAYQYSGRHNGGSDILFLDGHAKWYTYATAVGDNFPSAGGAMYCIE